MAGTIMEHFSTPMRLWFYAMFLMASTRCGISAKQLERELGVGYGVIKVREHTGLR